MYKLRGRFSLTMVPLLVPILGLYFRSQIGSDFATLREIFQSTTGSCTLYSVRA